MNHPSGGQVKVRGGVKRHPEAPLPPFRRASVGGWPFAPHRLAVIDTDVLIDELELAAEGGLTHVEMMAGSGGTRLLASWHVLVEMYQSDNLGNPDKFHKLAGQLSARRASAHPDELRAIFERRLLPWIWFVTAPETLSDPRIVEVGDLKDRPTAELAALVAPCGRVLSRDGELKGSGAAVSDAKAALRATVEAGIPHAVVGGALVGGAVAVSGLATLGDAVAARSGLSRCWLWSLAAAVCAGCMLIPRGRAWLSSRGQSVLSILIDAAERAAAADALLEVFEATPEIEGRLDCAAARILASSERPMMSAELHEALGRADHPWSLTEVRRLLREHPSFRQVGRGDPRWELGRRVEVVQ